MNSLAKQLTDNNKKFCLFFFVTDRVWNPTRARSFFFFNLILYIFVGEVGILPSVKFGSVC